MKGIHHKKHQRFIAGLLSLSMLLTQTPIAFAEKTQSFQEEIAEIVTESVDTAEANQWILDSRNHSFSPETEVETQTLATSDYSYEDFRSEFFGGFPSTYQKFNQDGTGYSYVDIEDTTDKPIQIPYTKEESLPEGEIIPLDQYVAPFTTYATSYSVGSTRTFNISNTMNTEISATGELLAQGTYCNIWFIDTQTGYTGSNAPTKAQLSGTVATQLAANCDVIYQRMNSLIPHRNTTVYLGLSYCPVVGDVDGDGRVNLIIYDIFDNGGGTDSYTGGYFTNGDYFNTKTTPIDAVHMNIGFNQGITPLESGDTFSIANFQDTFYGTFAHEFQHLLYNMYFGSYTSLVQVNGGDSYTDLWFNEHLSGVADVYYSSTSSSVSYAQNLEMGRVISGSINSYANGTAYGDLLNFNQSLKNYGMGYMMASMMGRLVLAICPIFITISEAI